MNWERPNINLTKKLTTNLLKCQFDRTQNVHGRSNIMVYSNNVESAVELSGAVGLGDLQNLVTASEVENILRNYGLL